MAGILPDHHRHLRTPGPHQLGSGEAEHPLSPSCASAGRRVAGAGRLTENIAAVERLGIPYYCYGFYRNGGAVEASALVSRAKAAGAR